MAEAPKVDESLGKKAAQEAGTAEHEGLIKTWDTYGRTAILVVVGLVGFAFFVLFGLPALVNEGGNTNNHTTLLTLLAVGLTIAGVVLWFKKGTGQILALLGVIILLVGPATVVHLSQSFMRWTQGGDESGPLPTTGEIVPSRTFGELRVFALADTWREVNVIPGSELCADPVTEVQMRPDSTDAVKYLRGMKRGQVTHVHFYFMPYGDDCVLSSPAPDETARPETQTNRQAHESERGGFSLSKYYCGTSRPKVPTAIVKMP